MYCQPFFTIHSSNITIHKGNISKHHLIFPTIPLCYIATSVITKASLPRKTSNSPLQCKRFCKPWPAAGPRTKWSAFVPCFLGWSTELENLCNSKTAQRIQQNKKQQHRIILRNLPIHKNHTLQQKFQQVKITRQQVRQEDHNREQ